MQIRDGINELLVLGIRATARARRLGRSEGASTYPAIQDRRLSAEDAVELTGIANALEVFAQRASSNAGRTLAEHAARFLMIGTSLEATRPLEPDGEASRGKR